MDNYNFDLNAELQSVFKMLGALRDATWLAGSWAALLSASLIFCSFRVLFGTDLDLLSQSEWE